MGMFDSVYVECPHCHKPMEFQSEAGKRRLSRYDLKQEQFPPATIAEDLSEFYEYCDHCGQVVKFPIVQTVTLFPFGVKGRDLMKGDAE